MDALIYEDTPLATYFEGHAIPYDIPRELTPPSSPFAPRGLPNLRERLRTIRRNTTTIHPTSSEQILERFRYIVVASQLLSHESGPRTGVAGHELEESDATTIQGATITAALSFLAAWTLHWLRGRKQGLKAASWLEVATYCLVLVLSVTAVTYLARRQYSKYIQKSAVTSLSKLVNDSHHLEGTAGGAVRFIQEVEVVARGYELSYPFPPVSRLEDRQAIRRCRTLRKELVNTLALLTTLYVESHNAIQAYISSVDLQRYHDIYEVSMVEYSEAVELANCLPEEMNDSLKDLRFGLRFYAIARKVFLCDLLALKPTAGWKRIRQWTAVFSILRELAEETALRHQSLSKTLHEEEWGLDLKERQSRRDTAASFQDSTEISHDNLQVKAEMRRFGDIASGVRALHAKIHVLQEEISGLTSANTNDAVVAASLSKHYESLGADIRALQFDWERGKNSMLLNADSDNRYSRASSGPRSPLSPSPSLGGLTIVDGGPADALRLLTGDDRSSRSSDATLFDEEVFEAVAIPKPRKRVSMGMSREEKIARLQEDRRKRATMQEQTDTTTNMLRELQMVMKHRPALISRSMNRVTSI